MNQPNHFKYSNVVTRVRVCTTYGTKQKNYRTAFFGLRFHCSHTDILLFPFHLCRVYGMIIVAVLFRLFICLRLPFHIKSHEKLHTH